MNQRVRLGYLHLALLLFSLNFIPSILAICGGPSVNWHNLSDTGCPANTNAGITADVFDMDIDIIGTNALVDGIHVAALTCDILITVTNGDAVITGSGNRCDMVGTASARLYLFAAAGRTITFSLENDLLFRGTANKTQMLDLLVTVSGPGTVIFNIADGQQVCFRSEGFEGGARLFIGMDFPNPPTLQFNRFNNNSPANVEICVGKKSCISFMAEAGDTTAAGTIEFNPTNLDVGCMILRLENCSCFDIRGNQLDVSLDSEILIDDIDLTTAEGNQARVRVVNNNVGGDAYGGLTVINENDKCTDLQIDPFCTGAFNVTGTQFGFILGPKGLLELNDITYLDYIGTTTNVCCPITTTDICGDEKESSRLRNGSAFIVDGEDNTTTVTIQFIGNSAAYFRSGVDVCGDVDEAGGFVINPRKKTPCQGEIVFDVEGQLAVIGDPAGNNALNVLSLEVTKTGCPIFVESNETEFPKRTFARDSLGRLKQYNSAAFLINNRMEIFDAALLHTDENHDVFEQANLGRSDLMSEPTYIGGDTWILCKPQQGRPVIVFYNGEFRVNTDVCSTGVDFLVPNLPGNPNDTRFIFFNNGFCIDKGYGRNMILGTSPCFVDCCNTTTDGASHLNVFQEVAQTPGTSHTLTLSVDFNSDCITEGVNRAEIFGQCAVQTIYLNNATNISIGTPAAMGVDAQGNSFMLTTTPSFLIDGSCFSFETRGGTLGYPEASGTTGEGGIFVDAQGVLRVLNMNVTNFATMVVRSRNGIIDLPKNSVFFDVRVGITDWLIDLTDPDQRIIVPNGSCFSNYTLDWGAVNKAYCCSPTDTGCFIPYDVKQTPQVCMCPTVTDANLTALPVVEGIVEQFQIKRSRICDQVHLQVDGGCIKELIFLTGFNSAEAPVGFLVVQNEGRVGINTAHRTVDSLEAALKLGVNGVQLVANGNGVIELNEDVLIDNVCHILSGTSFGLNPVTGMPEEQRLKIRATTAQELRIKPTGVLDLTQFNNTNKVLEIGGEVRVVVEPGARIIMNGGVLLFTDQAQLLLDPAEDANRPLGMTVVSTDDIRVKLSGNGFVVFEEDATTVIHQGAYLGVESFPQCDSVTSITWILRDQASLEIGNEEVPGGSFQVGDTTCTDTSRSVDFELVLAGIGTNLQIDRQGFFGLGVGIVDKASIIPNEWLVGCLANVRVVRVLINEGTMRHDQIVDGNTELASLLAVGNDGLFTFNFDPIESVIRGGGNLIKVNCNSVACLPTPTALTPTMTTFAGVNPNGLSETGIMSSKPLLDDKGLPQPTNVTAQAFFNFLKTLDNTVQLTPKTNVGTDHLNVTRLGFITGGTFINRIDYFRVLGGTSADPVDPDKSIELGAANININTVNGDINSVVQIQLT